MPSREQKKAWNKTARDQNRKERKKRRRALPEWVLNRESKAKLRGQDRQGARDRGEQRANRPGEIRKAKTRREAADQLDRTERNARRGETPQESRDRIAQMLGVKPSKKAAEPQPKGPAKPARNTARQSKSGGILRGMFGGKR